MGIWTPGPGATAGNDTFVGNGSDEVAAGGDGADVLRGEGGSDTLDGDAGDDRLIGGAGADELTGGLGDDFFYVDNAGDTVIEAAGEGADRVYASVNFTLQSGQHIERLMANAGLTGLALTGNEFANTIHGGAGDDVLNGGGGVDHALGGLGDDVVYVDNAGDLVTEAAGEGTDRVYASVSYTLRAGQFIEQLYANAGSMGLTLTGNAFANTIRGGAGADRLSGGAGADQLIGGQGDDFFYVDNAGDTVTETSGEGADRVYASVNYTLAEGQHIERLLANAGAAGLSLTGNAFANAIFGASGNDVLDGAGGDDNLVGGAGLDQMTGGLGDDFFYVDNAGDTVVEAVGEGTDRVYAAVNYTLQAGQYIERLLADAGATGLVLTGNAFVNTITGGAGADRLNGGLGADLLIGGLGDDFFYVDNAGDRVTEAAGEGSDRVYASVSYTLQAGQHVERLLANAGSTGLSLTGNAVGNAITGGTGNDVLDGAAGDDTLNGGAGLDDMTGGLGDDFFYVDDAGDTVAEAAGEGADRVYASVNYALQAGQHIERLVANAGSTGLALTGNAFANTVFGGAGNDSLDGGAGADHLLGGAGDDVAYVDNADDRVTEASGEGTDRVNASVNYALQAGQHVEELYAAAGSTGLALTGNEFTNLVVGGDGADRLNGRGGDDTLVGGLGDDFFYVDSAGDTVTEAAGEGTDRVYASVNYTLEAGQAIERLHANAGSTALELTGNELANVLYGGSGDDILNGAGGHDTLVGGDGADTFVLASIGETEDRINDFVSGVDRIELGPAGFGGGLAAGAVMLVSGAAPVASGSAGQFLYNTTNGQLFWDTDGAGGGAAVQVLTLQGAPTLVAGDIVPLNQAPTVAHALVDQSADEDEVFSFVVPANTFADVNPGDTLTLSAALSNGDPLPAWLSFDAGTATFSGAPENADVGVIGVRVTATDSEGAAVSDVFALTVVNTNDAPVAEAVTATVSEDGPGITITPDYTDPDAGDTHTVSIVDTGAVLGALTDNGDGTFTYDPSDLFESLADGDTATETFSYTVTDGANTSSTNTATVTITGANDAPTIANALADQSADEDDAFTYTVPGNAFADVDMSDALTLSAALSSGDPLPAWLTFDAGTATFSGTPLNDDVGAIIVRVTAADGSSASVYDEFTLSVGGTNDAPTVANAVADRAASEDAAFSFTVPANAFADVDLGDNLTLSAALSNGDPLPVWLNFDPGSGAFSGTPANGDVGAIDVRVTATDGSNATADDVFTLTVDNTNDTPTVASLLADQTTDEDAAFSYTVPANAFADVDLGDSLTLSAALSSGDPLPAWLSFNAGTGEFSGTPENGDVAAIDVRVTATDIDGATVDDTFTLTVVDTPDPPELSALSVSASDPTIGFIRRVSTDSAGAQANNSSSISAISANNRYVVFDSNASNLVAGDTNGTTDIFRKDLETGAIVRVSIDGAGVQGNSSSHELSISSDGRYVTFYSYASNLVSGDTNGVIDVFRKDVETGAIVRVSTDGAGGQANSSSLQAEMSSDGRYVTFYSDATNLVAGDTNARPDIFRKDLDTGAIERVSTDAAGGEANNDNLEPAISADGRYVTFYSNSTNLVAGDTNSTYDIFRKDLDTGAIVRVSTDASGAQGASSSSQPDISSDGRYVTFYSNANNLVAGDTNGTSDIFRKDLQTGAIVRVSTDAAGGQANLSSFRPSISSDGRYVTFYSNASNLVAGDTNGTHDIFRKDLDTGEIIRLSTDGSGVGGNGTSAEAAISADGRYVTFYSDASNLVAVDTNGTRDIFVVDLDAPAPDPALTEASVDFGFSFTAGVAGAHTLDADWTGDGLTDETHILADGVTTASLRHDFAADLDHTVTLTLTDVLGGEASLTARVQTAPDVSAIQRASTDGVGVQGNSNSYESSISADGRFVTFRSYASNLVAGDTNGTGDIFRKDLITGEIVRVSVDGAGAQGNSLSYLPSISSDGRYVTFMSSASNLVAGDTNGTWDIFRKDLTTNEIVRVSVDGAGVQGNSNSEQSAISPDGRYVTFMSYASNLVAGDTNGNADIFRKDLTTNAIVRVSVDGAGVQPNNYSYEPSISSDGRYVTFTSFAGNLVAGDTNGTQDVFRKDLNTGDLIRVSVDGAGAQGNDQSYFASISSDGRYVTFMSAASNLVAGDTNGTWDIFRKDLTTNEIVRVSVDGAGVQGNNSSEQPAISSDGRYVTFLSYASNLVAGDTNGIADIFRKDLTTNAIVRVSVDGAGVQPNNSSFEPSISLDGRYVTFYSYASNLVAGDTNGLPDIFVVDLLQTGATLTGDAGIDILIGEDFADTLSGLGGSDLIRGGNGADRISGGVGVDELSGGLGADSFVYASASEGGDAVTDFISGTDSIEIDAAGFGGGLSAGNPVTLVSGAAPVASGAGGQFLYNTSTGALSWDADGDGAGVAVLLATLQGAPAIVAGDFVVTATAPPIILDLDGDGISFSSGVAFDFDGDGALESGAWAEPGDGFLALDRNGDGTIAGLSEISFLGDVPGAATDLDGLAAFDTDGDGRLSSADARFADFRVWADANADGVSQADELLSLVQADIVSISLARTGEPSRDAAGNVIHGYAEVARADGSVFLAADVALGFLETPGGGAADRVLPQVREGNWFGGPDGGRIGPEIIVGPWGEDASRPAAGDDWLI